jgi:hypothetical protein
MLVELKRIFEQYEVDGRVRFAHESQLYLGRLT